MSNTSSQASSYMHNPFTLHGGGGGGLKSVYYIKLIISKIVSMFWAETRSYAKLD